MTGYISSRIGLLAFLTSLVSLANLLRYTSSLYKIDMVVRFVVPMVPVIRDVRELWYSHSASVEDGHLRMGNFIIEANDRPWTLHASMQANKARQPVRTYIVPKPRRPGGVEGCGIACCATTARGAW